MTWDLINVKPHAHRDGGEDAVVFMRKSVRRSKREGVSAVQFTVELVPLPLVTRQGNDKKLVPIEQAVFRVVADQQERKLLFDIASADAALPTLLRGGGLGSLAISELVLWAKQHCGDFAVATGRIPPSILNYPNAEPHAIACLQNLGFSVARAGAGGLQFGAESVGQLQAHVNNAKVELGVPAAWGTQLLQSNLGLAAQLLEQSGEIATLREQIHQVSQSRQSPVPFLGGILSGVVAGIAIAAFLFSI